MSMPNIEKDFVYRLRYRMATPFFNDISDMSYAVVKGQCLSLQAYNDIYKRNSSDIDILISRKDLLLFEDKLEKRQFKCVTSSRYDRLFYNMHSHQAPPYTKGITEIDINFDIFWGEYIGKRVDIADFLSDTIEVDICGCKVKTLPPIKALIQLILHNYKDINSIFLLSSRKVIKKSQFKDVFYLLKNNLLDIPMDKLYALCSSYGIIPYMYYMLYYTNVIYEDEMLKKYVTAFKTPDGSQLLNCYGLNEYERHEWRYDFNKRLNSENIYNLIKEDLTEKDLDKIKINKRVLLGEEGDEIG